MTPKTQSEVQTLISRVDRLGWISLEARNLGYGSSLLEEELAGEGGADRVEERVIDELGEFDGIQHESLDCKPFLLSI